MALLVGLAFGVAGSAPPAPLQGGGASAPEQIRADVKQGSRNFAPGVKLDWDKLAVELEAAVVLRDGPLELFACSPNTREHESILAVPARPTHIFQALGLIGLTPGSPVSYDEKLGRIRPPTGQPLDLSVRFKQGDEERTVPADRWLKEVESGKPPRSLTWVFAGSRTLPEGSFAADLEGTIACVVDFDSALISIGALHSASNEQLWLSANTAAIPPVGTKCSLIISAVVSQTVEVIIEVKPNGRLLRDGNEVRPKDLLRILHHEDPGAGETVFVLKRAEDASDQDLNSAVDNLADAGIHRRLIQVPGEPRSRERPNTSEEGP